jgi:hypothetical protein
MTNFAQGNPEKQLFKNRIRGTKQFFPFEVPACGLKHPPPKKAFLGGGFFILRMGWGPSPGEPFKNAKHSKANHF